MRASSSRLPGFYRMSIAERRALLADRCHLDVATLAALDGAAGLSELTADKMVENVVGTFALPLGLGLNFRVDSRDYIVPMVVEEPSVVAAISNTAQLVRAGGGFHGDMDPPLMVGQIQLVRLPDLGHAQAAIADARDRLIDQGNLLAHDLVKFGGGVRDLEVRLLDDTGDGGGPMLVVHLIVDCRDAMGANAVNTVAEGLAPELATITGGKAVLRILSNLADRRLARAAFSVPVESLGRGTDFSGEQVAENIIWAYRLAARDPYRAATHNKGIMNGIDAAAIALGNDWRALEAGAHAFAARSGRYTSLTTYAVAGGQLMGSIELPMAIGTVGGATRSHPTVKACREILGIEDAATLGKVLAAVGLAQNLGALRALASDGIQKGHMALHARQVALAAGAREEQVDHIAEELVQRKDIRVDLARELLGLEKP